jgi:hypothetical protein
MITYPPGSNLQNGTGTGSAPNIGSVLTLSPLTAGTTTAATGTASAANGPSSGPVTMSADGNFFYGNLTEQNSGQLIFVMGGAPVSQSFYAPTLAPRILAFNVQPDFALANGPQSQTIPFLPSFAGGTQPNAVVSPLYVVTPANEQFGAFNANTNPNITSPRFMQASLAINGQGATQTSALAVSTGVIRHGECR